MATLRVTTPDGRLPLAGFVRDNLCSWIDFWLAAISFGLVAHALNLTHHIFDYVGAAFATSYMLGARRTSVPSFGLWFLRVKRYPRSTVMELTGSGSVYVVIPLSEQRIIGCLVTIILLILFIFIAMGVDHFGAKSA